MFDRINDLWDRPISSTPGAWFDVIERKKTSKSDLELTSKVTRALNLGSYNYLGFAENHGPVNDQVIAELERNYAAAVSPMMDCGYSEAHKELETTIAEFLGKPAALIFSMGYATNSTTIPALVGKGGLILSDSLNHASLVTGCRNSGAKISPFKHNDMNDLERLLRKYIVEGQPRTHLPWNKIVIVAEGIYSMEGVVCQLPELIRLKKKYKAYLYVDEAHSIGALGARGRGVCDYHGCNPEDVDILMGTFTKSFGSVGGYICGSEELIRYLRATSFGSIYCTAMPTPCAIQALASLRIIMGKDGTDEGMKRLKKLKDNSNFFREGLLARGFRVFGAKDSPVIPMMCYHFAKFPALSRTLLSRHIAIVVVGFPATPLMLGRARFCISASHTTEDLEWALNEIDRVGDFALCKYGKRTIGPAKPSTLPPGLRKSK